MTQWLCRRLVTIGLFVVPVPACFHISEAYYTTLYHELVHASGHRSRLNRKTLTDLCLFGDPTYAKEELVAEMGASCALYSQRDRK